MIVGSFLDVLPFYNGAVDMLDDVVLADLDQSAQEGTDQFNRDGILPQVAHSLQVVLPVELEHYDATRILP